MNGFIMLALLPICIELGVEVTYPCAEGVVAGAIKFFGNLFGLFFFFMLEFLISIRETGDSDSDSGLALWYVMFTSLCCSIGGMFLHGRYLRKEFEEEKEKRISQGAIQDYGT